MTTETIPFFPLQIRFMFCYSTIASAHLPSCELSSGQTKDSSNKQQQAPPQRQGSYNAAAAAGAVPSASASAATGAQPGSQQSAVPVDPAAVAQSVTAPVQQSQPVSQPPQQQSAQQASSMRRHLVIFFALSIHFSDEVNFDLGLVFVAE